MPSFTWYNTIRFRVGMALFALFILQVGTGGFTLYQIDQRKHDYTILILSGQLRVISNAMIQQSTNYLKKNAARPAESDNELSEYYHALIQHIEITDKIINSFRNRTLAPELTGLTVPLECNWDKPSTDQFRTTAAMWDNFKPKLLQTLAAETKTPNIAAAARYVKENGDQLVGSVNALNRSFQKTMERKLAFIHLFNKISLIVFALLTALIAIGIYRRIARPLALTVKGFDRVANGDLGHQIPIVVENEIGAMTVSFNNLSNRLRSLFNLTDQINQGTNMYDTLRFVCKEFRAFIPVEWVGALILTPERSRYSLERLYAEEPGRLRENQTFNSSLGLPDGSIATARPYAVADIAALAGNLASESFLVSLLNDKKRSAVFLPLSSDRESRALLVFASSEANAYSSVHVDFLSNLAAQIGHVLEKTMVMEGLVIAAVEGLAKLAENRDPETGDHLVRMSLYAALISEELAREGSYSKLITPSYVREVFRFAPMHDIGKVGIRDEILLKPGRLDPEERIDMERHPVLGGQVLRRCEEQMNRLGHSIFAVGIEIAECHHEKFDGSGYPKGLKEAEIPLSARIIAVADVFDALTSKRPYKEAWPFEKALETVKKDAGSHFDPEVVAAFARVLPRVREVFEKHKHI